jgi:hypothetical protein
MTFGNRARLESDESMMRRVAGIEPQARPEYLVLRGADLAQSPTAGTPTGK